MVATAACLAGLTEDGDVAVWVAAAVGAVVLLALPFDAFAGIVVGLAGAAALIAVKRATGRWEASGFSAAMVETLGLVLAGAGAGWAGASLRRPFERESVLASNSVAPVFGSLGLLPYDIALQRLEEEMERAREHRRPLAVLVLDADIVGADLPADEREGALRTVARILETRIRERDLPFAVTPERLGAILPETTTTGAWERVGTVADALTEATFMSRANGHRVPLADVVRIEAGIAGIGAATTTAEGLLDRATAGIRRRVADPDPDPEAS